jgi:hypothetical protein
MQAVKLRLQGKVNMVSTTILNIAMGDNGSNNSSAEMGDGL